MPEKAPEQAPEHAEGNLGREGGTSGGREALRETAVLFVVIGLCGTRLVGLAAILPLCCVCVL